MSVPGDLAWELIVVDNGSTDGTREVIDQFNARLPIRAIREEIPGQSNARNAGIRVAKGTYIVWTDDDVLVHPNWLGAYAAAFRQWPDAAVFGGKILPQLEGSAPPRWFAENLDVLDGVLVSRDFGDLPLPLSINEGRIPYGANFVVRSVEQRTKLYDPNLGLAATRFRRGDEEEVIKAIFSAGASGYYIPESIVHHIIPEQRQTKEYVFSWYRGQGDAQAYIEYHGSAERGPMISGAPRWLWRSLARTWAKYVLARAFTSSKLWLPLFVDYARHRGAIDYFQYLKHHNG